MSRAEIAYRVGCKDGHERQLLVLFSHDGAKRQIVSARIVCEVCKQEDALTLTQTQRLLDIVETRP